METTLFELTPYRVYTSLPPDYLTDESEILSLKQDLINNHFYDLFEFDRLIRTTGVPPGKPQPEIKFDITPCLPSIKIKDEEYFEKWNLWEYVQRLRGKPKPDIPPRDLTGLEFCAMALTDEDFLCVYNNLRMFISNHATVVTITTPTKVEEVMDMLAPGMNERWRDRRRDENIVGDLQTILQEVVIKPIKRRAVDLDRSLHDGFDSLIAEALGKSPTLYLGELLEAVGDFLKHANPQPGCIVITPACVVYHYC